MSHADYIALAYGITAFVLIGAVATSVAGYYRVRRKLMDADPDSDSSLHGPLGEGRRCRER